MTTAAVFNERGKFSLMTGRDQVAGERDRPVPESALAAPAHEQPDRVAFAAFRLRTDAAKRFKKVRNATAVIWKMLRVAQQRFRRLNAQELITEVYPGAEYVTGVRIQRLPWEPAAGTLFAHP